MQSEAHFLLRDIEIFCRRARMAESTFGREAVNDGKLCSRLRSGRRITLETAARIRRYIAQFSPDGSDGAESAFGAEPSEAKGSNAMAAKAASAKKKAKQKPAGKATKAGPAEGALADDRPFRFYDNRQKYLSFVNTTNEKRKVAERAAKELTLLRPTPPALKIFDAGVGDGTVLSHLMRAMHQRFPTMPFLVVGKEISIEDVRLTLEKLPDRFMEHPASCIVITNLYYAEAPWLRPRSVRSAAALNWREVALEGTSSFSFGEQLAALDNFLVDGWQVRASEKTGNPMYVRPSVLVLYRKDHAFLMDSVIPKQGNFAANYDFALASQPWRARMSAEFKVQKVLAPIARSLGPSGRMLVVQSCGDDPALELIKKVWPDEEPFKVNRHELVRVLKKELGHDARSFNFVTGSDSKATFRYEMHTLPSEVQQSIGTSTLFAAWNDAIYVNQIEDERLEPVLANNDYLAHTAQVLKKHKGLWFNDESFVVSRKQ
jgi:hypothetical protein